MRKTIWPSLLLVGIFTLTAFLSQNIYAEYYIVYPAPGCVDCTSCGGCGYSTVVKKRTYHRVRAVTKKCYHRPRYRHVTYHKVKRSSATIQVYYFYNTLPPCYSQCNPCVRCSSCPSNSPCTRRAQQFVTFSGEPTSWRNVRSNDFNDPYDRDRATADDDAFAYPDMNIDH